MTRHGALLRIKADARSSTTWWRLGIIAVLWGAGCDGGEPYLVPQSRMEEQLELGRAQKVAAGSTDALGSGVAILMRLYPDAIVDSVYVDEAGSVQAFDFQIHSGVLGIANVPDHQTPPHRIDLYNAFDQRLIDAFRPSFSIYVFHNADGTFIYDDLGERLYSGYPDTLIQLSPGQRVGS